jgi:glycine/D-amino acid oxidase-like deaminating enzyme
MTTEKRDLRSGKSVWAEPPLIGNALTKDLEVEVLVIGGGITGILLAERLSPNFSVAIVDQRGAARGSTPASTGLLLFEIDTPLVELRKKIGRDAADRAWLRSHQAMSELLKRIEDHGIHCGMTRCESIYLPGKTLDVEGLRDEAAARIECGLPSRWIDASELRSYIPMDAGGAIVSGNSAKADPVRFALGFLQRAVSSGTEIFRDVDVVGIDAAKDKAIASTKAGFKIFAKSVVFATGYQLPKYLALPEKEIASTWVIATTRQSIAEPLRSSLIWEASDPYHYLRTTDDGRVIVGGEDEDFDDEERRNALTLEKAKRLQAWLGDLLPQLDPSIELVWSGAFGRSETGLPSIGALPGMPNCYAIVGFGGNGMTYAMIGAQMIEGMLLGEADPDADLFPLSRRRN